MTGIIGALSWNKGRGRFWIKPQKNYGNCGFCSVFVEEVSYREKCGGRGTEDIYM